MSDNMTPAGVKVIAWFYYLGAVVLVFSGIMKAAMSGASQTPDTFFFPGLSAQTAGLVQIAMGILLLFVGNGLSKGAGWARVMAIIFNILIIIDSLDMLTLTESVAWKIQFGVAVVISLYLAFSGAAREHFG